MRLTYQNGGTHLDLTLILGRRARAFWYLRFLSFNLSVLGHSGWEDSYTIIYSGTLEVPLGCLARFNPRHINCRGYSILGLGNKD